MMAALCKTGDYEEKYSAVLWHMKIYTVWRSCSSAFSELSPYIHRETVTDPEKNVHILLGAGAMDRRAPTNFKKI